MYYIAPYASTHLFDGVVRITHSCDPCACLDAINVVRRLIGGFRDDLICESPGDEGEAEEAKDHPEDRPHPPGRRNGDLHEKR